jgi:hypothetical protein
MGYDTVFLASVIWGIFKIITSHWTLYRKILDSYPYPRTYCFSAALKLFLWSLTPLASLDSGTRMYIDMI